MRKILLMCIAALFWTGIAFAQDRTITGKVIDETGSPLPGVNVSVKGTTRGVATDVSGNFSLNISNDDKLLLFSFVGYRSIEQSIGNQSVINVSLSSENQSLNEVIITAQGISKDKKSLGYAATSINSDEIGQNTNPINAIQGKIAGANITAGSNSPGSSSRIVLRGPTSFAGNNQPVFVIDGVISSNANTQNTDYLNNQVDYGNRGNDINPNDIESISVLKGPAAAALYGSIASNGAILITTKKGKKNGKMNINFSTGIQFSNILKLPTFQNEYGQGDVDKLKDDRRENFSWGLPFDGKERPYGQIVNGKQQLKKYEALPNNVKDFFQIGKTLTNSLSLSGGNEKSTYYLSLNSQNNTGVIPTSEYNKYNLRFNGSSEFSKNFSSSVSIGYTNINSKLPLGGQTNSIYNSIIQQPRDIPIVDQKDLNNPFNGTFTGADGTDYYGYYGAYSKNPYFLLENYKNTNKVDRITGNFSLIFKPFEGLSVTERVGADIYSDRRYQKFAKYNYLPFEPFYTDANKTNSWIDPGKYSENLINYSQFNHDLIFTYNKDLSNNFSLKLLAGNNIRKTVQNRSLVSTNATNGLVLKDYYNLSNSNGPLDAPISNNENSIFENSLVGFYGEANISYKSMLFLGVTGRNDISSTLPKNNNSYFYPSVNGSFVFTELLGNGTVSDIISFGKIRSSWAKVGADASAYLLNTTYSSQDITGNFGNTRFPLNSIPAFTRNDRIGSSNLQPEFTKSFEIGTELGFFKNLLSVDVTYFKTSSTNQIVNAPIAASTGYTSITINAGEMKNEGIEIAVRATPIKTESGFKWDVFGTFTKVKNSVVSINQGLEQLNLGGLSSMAIVAAVGKPYGTFYGVDYQRDPNGNTVIDNQTGLPVTGPNRYFGSYLPNYQASLGSTFTFKNFSLNVLFDTKQGGQFYSGTKNTMDFVGTSTETTQNGRKDYIFPNSVIQNADGTFTNNTNITFHPYTYYTNTIQASQHLIDASYIKFREASLSYAIPSNFLKKTPFTAISASIFGNNLFIWTPKQNEYSDPEINSQGASNAQGFEFNANPSLRNYGFRVNMNF